MMLAIICWIGCLFFQGVFGDTSCPDSWMPYNGACYLFAFDQRMPFNSAQHFCMQHGASLAHVTDVHEGNFLRNFLTHVKPTPWWIGLNDQQIEGEFTWIDSNSPLIYTEWEKGYPHSANDTHNVDCVFLQPNGYRWGDVHCTNHFQPICQKLGSNSQPMVG